jgi:predicted DsbA family dithiol-disulfide isomerase
VPDLAPLTVDVVSDVVCPWCFLGKRRLDAAIAAVPEIDVDVRWRPFQLDPTIPRGGRDREGYLREKFGDPGRIAAAHEQLRALGREVGIAFDFEAIAISPNTLDAHRLIRWAAVEGVQDALVERLFTLYFVEAANLADPAVLAAAAADAGMDRAVAARLLAGDADRDEVVREIETAQRMGVTGVPCFILAGKYAVMGAQPADTLAGALRQAAAEQAEAAEG